MKKLVKGIYIILLLILVIVLIFYVIDRSGIQTPLSNINKQYCGDQICQTNENHDNCCMDCGCPNNEVCVNNKCQISMTTSIPPTTTQTTTIKSIPSEGDTEPSGETSSETTGVTTQTTTILGCSYDNCEACTNKTYCYKVGCVWCLSNRCLRICKGLVSIT